MRKILFVFLILLQLSIYNNVYASVALAAPQASTEEKKPEPVKDELGRDTPRGMISGFMDALSKQDYKKALDYMDTNNISKIQQRQGPELAKQFHSLLDQNGWIMSANKISNSPEGDAEDELELGVEKVGGFRTSKQSIPIMASRHISENAEVASYWQISADTLNQMALIQKESRTSFLNDHLPASLIEHQIAGVPIGHWLAMVALIVLSYVLVWFTTTLILISFCKLRTKFQKRDSEEIQQKKEITNIFKKPLQLIFAIIIAFIGMRMLGFTVLARQTFMQCAQVVVWVSIVWIIWNIIDVIADGIKRRLSERGQYDAVSAIVFLRRGAKFTLLIILFITVLDNFGFQITTWIAALGIGGIAVALGTQKTVENFVGSLTLIADRPIAIGDFCRFGTTKGTVEDIGMRSTRVRTQDRTIISIPNGEFSSMQIENYTKRDKFYYKQLIGISYETKAEQIKNLLTALRAILKEHPKVIFHSGKAILLELSASSINIEVTAYIRAKNPDDADNLKEEISIKIIEAVEELGISFSAPSQKFFVTNLPA